MIGRQLGGLYVIKKSNLINIMNIFVPNVKKSPNVVSNVVLMRSVLMCI